MHRAARWRLPLAVLFVLACVVALGACARMVPSQRPQLTLHEVHPFGARRVAFSSSGERLATGGLRGEVLVWSVPGGERLARLTGHDEAINGLHWVDETRLLSTDAGGGIRVWDLPGRASITALQSEPVTAAAWWPAPRRLVTGHRDGRLRTLAYPDLKPAAETRLGSRILSVAIEPRRQWLAVSTADKRVRLLDADMRPVKDLQMPPGKAFELRFSPDARELAGGGWFRLYLWDTASGELQVRETEHNGAIISLDYSPDGRQLVSIGRITDARVRLIDTRSGDISRRLSTQPLCGWNVRFSPGGRYVASSSEDGSVFLYDVSMPYRPTFYQGPLKGD